MIKHLSFIIILLGCYVLWEQRPVWHGEGITVQEMPEFKSLRSAKSIETDNFILTPVAAIEGSSRIIGRNFYWLDEYSTLSPVDFLLGWDKMSDEYYLQRMQIKINDRQHSVRYAIERIPQNNISEMVLHMHAIPSNEHIRSQMRWIRRGHIIEFSGYIVEVEHKSMFKEPGRSVRLPVFKNQRSYFIWVENLSVQ